MLPSIPHSDDLQVIFLHFELHLNQKVTFLTYINKKHNNNYNE